MPDDYAYYSPTLEAPADGGDEVTLSDTAELATHSRSLWVGGAGNLKVTTVRGKTFTLRNIPAGTLLPIRAKLCWATGSAATYVVALY